MLSVYGGKCLSRKPVRNWGGKRFADDKEVETGVRNWLTQQLKDFYEYAANFDILVKRRDKCYQC
jgi:hypothetical protein